MSSLSNRYSVKITDEDTGAMYVGAYTSDNLFAVSQLSNDVPDFFHSNIENGVKQSFHFESLHARYLIVVN